MNRTARQAWAMALVGLLAAGCGGNTTTSSDAGAPDATHAAPDAAPDTSIYSGPRVRDVCNYAGQEAEPECPYTPFAYDCPQEMGDPDCVLSSVLEHGYDGNVGYFYDCRTRPDGTGYDAGPPPAPGDALAAVCEYYHSPSNPLQPDYPYIYYCSKLVGLPDCIADVGTPPLSLPVQPLRVLLQSAAVAPRSQRHEPASISRGRELHDGAARAGAVPPVGPVHTGTVHGDITAHAGDGFPSISKQASSEPRAV